MRIKQLIPNLLTLANLACGLIAVVFLTMPQRNLVQYETIGWLMLAALAFDFLDGFVARMLKATSEIGKQLDSLADLLSFGVLPGLMVYHILKQQLEPRFGGMDPGGPTLFAYPELPAFALWLPFIGLLIPMFSAYRLAKFNVDTRQSYGFRGLPTPANAVFFLSIFLMYGLDKSDTPAVLSWMQHPLLLCVLVLGFSVLLVSGIPLLALKFKGYGLRENWTRFLLIIISLILLLWMSYRAVPIVIAMYFVLSLIHAATSKKA